MNERDQLATFHQTISKQLNARLEESPRFFWALVVVSTGYGYLLWNYAVKPESGSHTIATVAALLSYFAILWASWYLAALGYAFRFLQNAQHCIEHALGWHEYAPEPRNPPERICIRDVFWLLPSIYHAHVFGLCAFLGVVVVSYCRLLGGRVYIGVIAFVLGILFIFGINWWYLWKFRQRPKPDPKAAVLSAPNALA
jgi:hypothetical protein